MAKDQQTSQQRFAHALLSPLTVVLGAAETLQAQAEQWPPVAQELLDLILTHGRHLQRTLNRLVDSAEVEGAVVRTHWTDPAAGARPPAAQETPAERLPIRLAEADRRPNQAPLEIAQGALHILVVDDDAPTRTVLREMLRESGYHVTLTCSGMEAIDQARSERPDLILLDILMPGVDGLQMHTVFREDPLFADVPIVIVTAAVGLENLDSTTIPWIVPKPIHPEQLLQTIEAARHAARRRDRPCVLIIDDDEALRRELRDGLEKCGYSTCEAGTGLEGLQEVTRSCPDVVLLELVLPDVDGMEVLQRLRGQNATLTLPVVLLSVLDDPTIKAKGLRQGADDYVSKPFSMLELSARIDATLRRKEREYFLSPSTRLPGNIAIERTLRRLVTSGEIFAVCYADLDHFKAYNDVYGFLKGDGVIHQTARVLLQAVREQGNPDDFVGHVGGDDFVIVTTPNRARAICQRAVREFDQVIPLYYDAEARARGYIEAIDRQGQPARFPLTTISLVIVSNEEHEIDHPGQLVDLITELKQQAKRIPGSSILSL